MINYKKNCNHRGHWHHGDRSMGSRSFDLRDNYKLLTFRTHMAYTTFLCDHRYTALKANTLTQTHPLDEIATGQQQKFPFSVECSKTHKIRRNIKRI